GHRPHVPLRAVGRFEPVVGVERPKLLDEAPVLVGGEHLGLGPGDRGNCLDTGDGHRVCTFFVDGFGRDRLVTKSRYISMASSVRLAQRSPPGSLEICWSVRPVPIAVNRSMSRGSSMPSDAR